MDAVRFNVIAHVAGDGAGRQATLQGAAERCRRRRWCGTPAVTFSTHFDCVPPFFPSRIEGDRLYGRGACDAKGILAAQVAAADRLRRDGETRVGLLFVVGEERGSDGARAANERRSARQPRFWSTASRPTTGSASPRAGSCG